MSRKSFGSAFFGLVVVLSLSSPSAFADSCTDVGPVPTYGTFAAGGINNSYGLQSCLPGNNGSAFYNGTDTTVYTYQNSTPVGSASGAVGTASWGLSSASANLATGNISVSATSIGNPPFNSSPPPFGSPASAEAGYFIQLVFSGGQGQQGSVSMGGLMSYSGNVSVTASLNMFTGGYQGLLGGYNVISGTDLAATGNQSWSVPAQNFTINDGVTYTLVAFVNAMTSGSFLPGSVTLTDPVSFALPAGVTFTASDPQFLTLATTPLPPAFPLFATGLGVMGLCACRKKRKSRNLAV